MGRIRMPPTGERYKRKVEEWLQSLSDHEFELLAGQRDQLIRRMEELYRSLYREVGMQSS